MMDFYKCFIINRDKLTLLSIIVILSSIYFILLAEAVQPRIEIYAKKEFIIDFNKFKIGDTIPARYQTPEYVIKQWHLRHLPVPNIGTHWVYVNENYLLISDLDGKIYKAYDRDIFYLQ